jgi:RNA polymerase sigma-70 factor (ECF subfamily)
VASFFLHFARAAPALSVLYNDGSERLIESDQVLVELSRGGDRRAFDEIVRRTGKWIYARLYLETGNPELAEDLAQETYLLAWRSIGKLNRGASIRGWLASVANRVAIDAARRKRRIKRGGRLRLVPLGFGDSENSPPRDKGLSPSEAAELQEQSVRILQAMRELPEEYRQVLALRYLAGADYDTIARQLALSNGSLRGLLARGLELLRSNLDPEPSESGAEEERAERGGQ